MPVPKARLHTLARELTEPYGEVRLKALGLIGDRLHVLIYTIRRTSTWIISLRKANNREADYYEGDG